MPRIIIPIIIILLFDFYVFQAIKTAATHWLPVVKYGFFILFWLSTILLVSFLILSSLGMITRNTPYIRWWIFAMFFMTLPKFIIFFFLFLEDIVRIISGFITCFISEKPLKETTLGMPRSVFLSKMAILIGTVPSVLLFYGIIRNTYNYQVKKVKLKLTKLPEVFKGFKIVQISDVHIGSLTDKEKVQQGIELINEQKPDVVLFTGDLVNNLASEMNGWTDVFSKIQAKEGVFSVLGNHDYGDYVRWQNRNDKLQNLQNLVNLQAKMGWRLLKNEHQLLEKSGKKLAILGVENWSAKARFPKYGRLANAYRGTENADVKILLSHDPSHWDAEILTQYKDIDLTLSGHTHGMQFGVEIFGYKWSPIKYIYKQWAGLYKKNEQYLYVNRGFGVLGYPGRVGILPEITVIELV